MTQFDTVVASEEAQAHPGELALGALDGAEYHAKRVGEASGLKPRVLEHVWASAAMVYALLEVAKQVGRVADALGRKR